MRRHSNENSGNNSLRLVPRTTQRCLDEPRKANPGKKRQCIEIENDTVTAQKKSRCIRAPDKPGPAAPRNKKTKTQNGGVWVLQERIDLALARELLDNLPQAHRDRKILVHMLEHTDPNTGLHEAVYRHGGGRDSGRIYGSNCVQRLSSGTRNFLLVATHTDIDVGNCFPVILYQVCT